MGTPDATGDQKQKRAPAIEFNPQTLEDLIGFSGKDLPVRFDRLVDSKTVGILRKTVDRIKELEDRIKELEDQLAAAAKVAVDSPVAQESSADAQSNDGPSQSAPVAPTELVAPAIAQEEKQAILERAKKHGYGEREGWSCPVTIDGIKWTYRLEERGSGKSYNLYWSRTRWDSTKGKMIKESFKKSEGYNVDNPPREVLEYLKDGKNKGFRKGKY